MQKLVSVIAATSMMVLSAVPMAHASPVSGYEDLYNQVITACSLGVGTVKDCEVAITAYSTALVEAEVTIEAANSSFTAARKTVFDLNAADEEFQKAIDELFELLLPDSGAIGLEISPG